MIACFLTFLTINDMSHSFSALLDFRTLLIPTSFHRISHSHGVETLASMGIPDLRAPILLLVAIRCVYKVSASPVLSAV